MNGDRFSEPVPKEYTNRDGFAEPVPIKIKKGGQVLQTCPPVFLGFCVFTFPRARALAAFLTLLVFTNRRIPAGSLTTTSLSVLSTTLAGALSRLIVLLYWKHAVDQRY